MFVLPLSASAPWGSTSAGGPELPYDSQPAPIPLALAAKAVLATTLNLLNPQPAGCQSVDSTGGPAESPQQVLARLQQALGILDATLSPSPSRTPRTVNELKAGAPSGASQPTLLLALSLSVVTACAWALS